MFAKKGPARSSAGSRSPKTSLEYLYARRLALDTVIEHLEQYDQCRAKRLDDRRRKSA